MSGEFGGVTYNGVDDVTALLERYGEGSADVATEVIHASGREIASEIDRLIPVSGRRFKGHAHGARGSDWPKIDAKKPLEVTVGTKRAYGYLYFPDDGSNTRRHRGGKYFFARGLDVATPRIIKAIQERLAEEFGG